MKKLIIILFSTISIVSVAQEKLTWDYPVKPGIDEWKSFETGKEMILACQIPDSILRVLSTYELSIK